MSKDIRWKQRFQNFSKALALLREGEAGSLSDLEREGILQRFEITLDLWAARSIGASRRCRELQNNLQRQEKRDYRWAIDRPHKLPRFLPRRTFVVAAL